MVKVIPLKVDVRGAVPLRGIIVHGPPVPRRLVSALRAANLLQEGESLEYVLRQKSCDGRQTCIEAGVVRAKAAGRGRKKGARDE
jgi:hypothetical protein